MKKISRLIVAGFLSALILAGASFKANAGVPSAFALAGAAFRVKVVNPDGKNAISKKVVVTPAKTHICGQAANTSAHSPKVH